VRLARPHTLHLPLLRLQYGWYPEACTTARALICEIEKENLPCPPAPPPRPPPPTGLTCIPADNDRTYCNTNVSNACYFYNSTAATYINAKASCAALGGFLAAYNSPEEQVGGQEAARLNECCPGMPHLHQQPCGRWLLTKRMARARLQLYVERYFYGSGSTSAMAATYWLGLEKSGVTYYWLDGKNAGNGMVSNANPYAHFAYDYHDLATPSLNCTIAHASRTYANYTGAHQHTGAACRPLCKPPRTASAIVDAHDMV
jgi:hypothetical protein